jgi:hypothetical protein
MVCEKQVHHHTTSKVACKLHCNLDEVLSSDRMELIWTCKFVHITVVFTRPIKNNGFLFLIGQQ